MTDPLPPSAAPILQYTNLKRPTLTVPAMRSGPYLVTAYHATLPPVCPICGQPGTRGPVEIRIDVINSFSFSVLPYPHIVTLEITLCEHHHRLRRRARASIVPFAIATIVIAGSIFFLRARGSDFGAPTVLALLGFGLLCLLAIGVCYVVATRGPRKYRGERDHAYLAGVHPNLLAQLPSFPDPPSSKLSSR